MDQWVFIHKQGGGSFMMRKMLAATLALGLMANGASAQVSGEEAKARKEAAAARAQAERLAEQAKALADEMKAQQAAMQKRIEALEKQLRSARDEADGSRKRSNEAVEKARTEMRKALTERRAKGEAAPERKKEAYIGVVTDKAPEVLSAHLGFKGGLIVTQVLPDSPAANSGLKSNDVIISMNGKNVESPEQFKKLVVAEKGGATADFVVIRGGQKTKMAVKLGERDADRLGGFFEGGEGFGQKFKMGDGENVFRWKADPKAEGRLFEKVVPGVEGRVGPGGVWEPGKPGGARVFVRPGVGAGAGGAGANVTLSINNNDGNITISGSVTQDGKTTNFKESGTKEELLKKIDKFPEKVRDSVKHSLEGSESGPGGKVRFRLDSRAQAEPGKDGERRVTVKALDPKAFAELKALHGDDMKKFHADMEKLHKDLKVHVIDGDHLKALKEMKIDGEQMKALKDLKVHMLDAKTGALKELEALKGDHLKKLEGLKLDVKALKLDELKGLELKELEGLKDLDVKVRVLGPENLKDLDDKLRKEIEIQVERSIKDAGLKDKIKDKIKDKKVIIERRDSQ
jgi:hypothetical protein